jgi:hypothetical protein
MNTRNIIKHSFQEIFDQLGAIRYKNIEDVRSRVGKDNQFTVRCTLSGLPREEHFAGTLHEALTTLDYTQIMVIKNELISYEVSSEYAYASSGGYPLVLSEGKYADHSDFQLIIFYFLVRKLYPNNCNFD